MKVKLFMAENPKAIEDQINGWLENIGPAAIIKTETVLTTASEKGKDGFRPCIVVTIWYEPGDS
jgi:hypothetical protein